MSNHLAAAAVSATLRKLLQTAVDSALPGVSSARVTTLRPSSPTAELPTPGVNIFLYQVTPNGPLRTIDQPTRAADGTMVQRPQTALELHYLISFSGEDSKLEPQILLGIVSRALHTAPVITRQNIEAMLADPTFNFMAGSDLQSAPDLVRVSPVPLSLEDLSKLWSVVFQTPYVLSQVYRAAVIFIDATASPKPALRVSKTRLGLDASMGPQIDVVLSQTALDAPVSANAPIVTGNFLVLVGRNLLVEVVAVRVGTVELRPDPPSANATSLKVQLPATILAGVQSVQVVQRRAVAPSPLDLHSNSLQFQLQPAITASYAAGRVTVGFTPAVAQAQQVQLMLNQFGAPAGAVPRAFTFEVPRRTATTPQSSLLVDTPGLASGQYLVRARVDGAESVLAQDPDTGRYDAPLVTV